MKLEMKGISKLFGQAYALQGVDLTVGEGEIHALLGENGAGKSTLMNILGGVLSATEGEIIIDGKKTAFHNAKETQNAGIRFVHQELNMFNDLMIYENMFIGEEKTKYGILDRRTMIHETEQAIRLMGLNLNPKTYIRDLNTARKQQLEIIKSVYNECKLLILDEPTTALTDKEIALLFDIMRDLKKRGISIIFITHKLPEVMAICDRYTILRDGHFISSGNIKDISENEISSLMVGRNLNLDSITKAPVKEDPYFVVENLCVGNFVKNVSFHVNRGEVLVLTGLIGDGRSELAEALFGSRSITSGFVYKDGRKVKYNGVSSVMRQGIGMVQANRKERSILPNMTILDNMITGRLITKHKSLWLSLAERMRVFERNKPITKIKVGSPMDAITSLSGGNQQKVILSRWLETEADVLLLDNPTQGVDVGAKSDFHKLINEMAANGKSIIVFTNEYPELYHVADRVLVMYQGEINAELKREELSADKVMYYSTGSNLTEGGNNHE